MRLLLVFMLAGLTAGCIWMMPEVLDPEYHGSGKYGHLLALFPPIVRFAIVGIAAAFFGVAVLSTVLEIVTGQSVELDGRGISVPFLFHRREIAWHEVQGIEVRMDKRSIPSRIKIIGPKSNGIADILFPNQITLARMGLKMDGPEVVRFLHGKRPDLI